jgi:peptidoglycan/xylan/chitin deacetylase (PgdA/CDA1 family)
VPLSVGIIGSLLGDDINWNIYLVDVLNNPANGFEIVNHGWTHDDDEHFDRFSKEEQSQLLKWANDNIELYLRHRPRVFIPPYNDFNE